MGALIRLEALATASSEPILQTEERYELKILDTFIKYLIIISLFTLNSRIPNMADLNAELIGFRFMNTQQSN